MATESTPKTVKIPQRGFDEIEQLATHATRLQDVLRAAGNSLANSQSSTTNEKVASETKIDVKEVELLLSGIATQRTLMDRLDASADELMKIITASIQLDAPEPWLAKNLKNWESAVSYVSAALIDLGPDHPILVRQKARELTYIHQNIFLSNRIITDLRPIFNGVGDSIQAMVLTHVLSIEYFDGVRNQRIEFALDEKDVTALHESTARAHVKTRTMRKAFNSDQWLLIVAGEDGPAAD